jgi:hypothetical protein
VGEAAELVTQRLGRANDQGVELIDRGGTRLDRSRSSGHQRAQRLTDAAGARLRVPVATQRRPRGAHRVELVALGLGALIILRRAVDLQHPLIAVGEE